MHRLLTTTAVALLLGVAPALAIDNSAKDQSNALPEASQSNELFRPRCRASRA